MFRRVDLEIETWVSYNKVVAEVYHDLGRTGLNGVLTQTFSKFFLLLREKSLQLDK